MTRANISYTHSKHRPPREEKGLRVGRPGRARLQEKGAGGRNRRYWQNIPGEGREDASLFGGGERKRVHMKILLGR